MTPENLPTRRWWTRTCGPTPHLSGLTAWSPPSNAWLTEVGVLKGGEGGSSDKAKVSDLHSTIQGEEDVGGLQVSVHHAFLVDVKHCI